MSWSIYPEIRSAPAAEAKVALDKQNIPQVIKDYLHAGVDAIVEGQGEDALVTVTGFGHVASGVGTDTETKVTADVRHAGIRAAAVQGEEASREPPVVTKR